MPIYAVIDTNVLVSAMLSKHNNSATVLLVERMLQGDLIPVFSSETMREYAEALSQPVVHSVTKGNAEYPRQESLRQNIQAPSRIFVIYFRKIAHFRNL